MAVTISQDNATISIRAAASADDIPDAIVTTIGVLFPAATEMVTRYAPNAPDAVHNAALVRLLGWLYETSPAEQGTRQGIIASGAAALLAFWRDHRAGVIAGLDAGGTPSASPGAGLPNAPADGSFMLTTQNGVLEWVEFPLPS